MRTTGIEASPRLTRSIHITTSLRPSLSSPPSVTSRTLPSTISIKCVEESLPRSLPIGARRLASAALATESSGRKLFTGCKRFAAMAPKILLATTLRAVGLLKRGLLRLTSNTTVVDLSNFPGITTMDNSPMFSRQALTTVNCICLKTLS